MADAELTERIVYEQSVRAITEQARRLEELRTRGAIILTASGIIAGFLAGTALEDGTGAFGALAIIAFAAVAVSCIVVLLPLKQRWLFVDSAQILLEDHVDVPERNEPAKLYRWLAETLEKHYDHNEKTIECLFASFWVACIALAVETALWLLELAVG